MALSNRKRLCTCRLPRCPATRFTDPIRSPCDREIPKPERISRTTTTTDYERDGIRQTKTTETIEYKRHGIRQTKTTETIECKRDGIRQTKTTETIECKRDGNRRTKTTDFLTRTALSFIRVVPSLIRATHSLIDIFQTLPSFLGF